MVAGKDCWPRLLWLLLLGLSGCWSAGDSEVIVATALDEEFSRPILEKFTEESGVQVFSRVDTEATKTVALAQAIINERERPQTDVFWNNEILHTLLLERQGLLDAYSPPLAQEYPEALRSPQGTWHGFAARARVLIVNTDRVPPEERPTSILDLTDEKWRGKVGIAKPLAGTTATHVACLFAVWGEQKAKEYILALKRNDVRILAGNKQVALAVASGTSDVVIGLTDTDDAVIEIEAGRAVAIIYLDREPDQLGTLFIPNTLSVLKNAPHPKAARKLVDFLLRPEVETLLASGRGAQIPLHPQATPNDRVETPRTVHAMQVDFS
ncbi:MAG: extracellular solute-binding protein, partial [Planctomycetales bacterium]